MGGRNGGARAARRSRAPRASIADAIAREAIERRAAQKLSELGPLVELVLDRGPRAVVEIGTMAGGTLYAWCRAAAPDATLVSIDLPGGPFGGGYDEEQIEVMRGFAQPGQTLHFLRCDSHDPRTAAELNRVLAGESIDFLMIDADHTYEGVRADFDLYAPFVRPGGMIALHDVLPHPGMPECQVDRLWRQVRRRYEYTEFLDPDDDIGFGQWGGIGVVFVQ